jgi:hypothetical protein
MPPSITIVSPVRRGFSVRAGSRRAVGFIGFPFL